MATKGKIEKQSKLVQALFDYIDSDEGQAIIKKVGLISANSIVGTNKSRQASEKAAALIVSVCAAFSIVAVVAITAYMIYRAHLHLLRLVSEISYLKQNGFLLKESSVFFTLS